MLYFNLTYLVLCQLFEIIEYRYQNLSLHFRFTEFVSFFSSFICAKFKMRTESISLPQEQLNFYTTPQTLDFGGKKFYRADEQKFFRKLELGFPAK